VAAGVARLLLPKKAGPLVTVASLSALAAVLSAFMNNVGALALLMPVALSIASRSNTPPGRLLMPLAFASILGGMTTLIGTPPNLIVSGFRDETGAGTFRMFDFSPVGLAVAGVGIAFIVLVGWRLVPVRERAGVESFETEAYLTEARVPPNSKAVGMTLAAVEDALEEADAQVIGLVRDDVRIPAPDPRRRIHLDDILLIEANPEALGRSLSLLDLRLEEDRAGETSEADDGVERTAKPLGSEEIALAEVALLPGSSLAGRSVQDVQLRTRYGINLLAVSRQGRRRLSRLRSMSLAPGDVLLLQGDRSALAEFASHFGGVPLAERPLALPRKREALLAAAIMTLGVAAAAFGLVPAALSFAGAALAAVLLGLVPPRRFYDSVDLSVLVLLGALIPVAQATSTTGVADLVGRLLASNVAQGNALVALTLVLVVSMTLSDFMNNTATAAMMCPIAISIAEGLGASADPFLMAVAVGASCAFLTPIGHQNNTLILGPGGFQFGDYWRLGLPLEVLVVLVAVPTLVTVWPL
jgi:di/tricarboxylate transporter